MLRVDDSSVCYTYRLHGFRLLYHPPNEGGILIFLLRQYVPQRQGDNYAGTYSTNSDEQNVASVTLRLPLHCHSDSELASWLPGLLM